MLFHCCAISVQWPEPHKNEKKPLDAVQPLFFINILVGIALALCLAYVAWGRERDLTVWALARRSASNSNINSIRLSLTGAEHGWIKKMS